MASGVFSIRQQAQAAGHGAWTGAQTTPYVEYLVVAGGGAGNYTGGGGAGGLLQGIVSVANGAILTVTVGAGGTGVAGNAGQGTAGSNSVFSNITSIGGGLGVTNYQNVGSTNNGGSGGGGSAINPLSTANIPNAGGSGTSGQGNTGGTGINNNSSYWGGGGGGAGTVGLPAVNGTATGNGGAGIASSISGTVTTYAGGGGGGGAFYTGTAATGGVGGGGAGGTGSGNGTSGTANTGGGGGSGSYNGSFSTSGSGGSGIVIVSYPDIYNAPASFGGANSPTSTLKGNGSLYFNGSSYIDYGANTSNYATGDFTIEAWTYYNSFTSGYTLWFSMDPNYTYFGPTSSTRTVINLGSGGELAYTTSVISLGTWYHTAIVRSGTTITLYINGVSQGTNTSSATLGNSGGNIRIGSAAGYALNGYLSNVRYTKSAVYTSAFTPSLYPLTPLANTRLLTAVTSVGTYTDETGNSISQTVTGSPAFNSSMPFQSGIGLQNRVYTWTGSGTVTF
jgi:Concanavalin A-like lectin/glucanases superfamily